MKSTAAMFLGLFILSAVPALGQLNRPPVSPPAVECELLPVATDPIVSLRVCFQVGSCADPRGKEGLAALTAQMLAEGSTTNHSYEEILDLLHPIAGGYSASVSAETTVIQARIHRDNIEDFYGLFIDAILHPAFRQEDLDRLKADALNSVQNELRYASDEELAKAVLYKEVFAGTAYAHPTAGLAQSLQSITLADVKQFYNDHLMMRNGVVVGIGGNYPNALPARLRQDLAALPFRGPIVLGGGTLDYIWPKPPALRGLHVTIVEKPCGATAISLGFPLPVLRSDPDWYALAVANSWLGQHRNAVSHLYQVIREQRGLNYGDYSYIERFPYGGQLLVPPTNVVSHWQLFEIWIRPVPNEARHFVLRAALREFQKLVDTGLTEEQFQQTRQFLHKYILHYAPTTMDRLGYALDDRLYSPHGVWDTSGNFLEKFRDKMETLTLADVNAAIKRHWQYENFQIVIVTRDAATLAKALAADTPSPITYRTPKPPAVLDEDRQISVYPLKISAANVRIVPVEELFEK